MLRTSPSRLLSRTKLTRSSRSQLPLPHVLRCVVTAALLASPGCAPEESAPPAAGGREGDPITVGSGELEALAFPVPAAGTRETLAKQGSCPFGSKLLTPSRTFTFPAGAREREVSATGKTLCFGLGETYHCHTSGTSTGFCDDWVRNAGNAVFGPDSEDGRFARGYLAARAGLSPRPRFNVSGHSQGGPDAAQTAELLGPGDQLVLLQPASSALYLQASLHGALARGARVLIAWSEGDEASLLITKLDAGKDPLPLIRMPKNVSDAAERCGVRLHNAPNARHVLHALIGMPPSRTLSPALDASILSNPGSPCRERGNLALTCAAPVPWSCPAWASE